MDTHFASPERASSNELSAEIEIINTNPVMSGLLHSVGGLLAILDEHRQIVALNDSFLRFLGIEDPSEALGLRPGEALRCIHAEEEPAGCGTTLFCSTCGAAIAIVASLGNDRPAERICALAAQKAGKTVDIALLVRSQPVRIASRKFLLLFLQDITLQQQRASLERTFFHDINNILTGLLGASQLLVRESRASDLVDIIHHSALRLKKEVEAQRCLSMSNSCAYQPIWHEIEANRITAELRSFFANHPAARGKRLHLREHEHRLVLQTDFSLLLRVLGNMITNALEATAPRGEVKVWAEQREATVSFCVWNPDPIPADIARRIFQRNFSTKEGAGRGIGTYSMKLFGEQILGGRVGFTSSEAEGTLFSLTLPLARKEDLTV
jgi:signal transduction histidine kinase